MQEITTIGNIDIKSKIFTIREQQVMLDKDLAELYSVETKRINEAVKNNTDKFPDDFYFELAENEENFLRSNFSTLKNSTRGKHRKYPIKAFTEQGVYMLATILKSKIASQITVSIIRTFVNMRKLINSNNFYTEQLKNIEKRQLSYEIKSDENFDKIFKALESNDPIQAQGIFYNG